MKAKWRKDWSEASYEDFQNAARTLRGMCKTERSRGNTGLAVTLDGAAYALDRFSSIRLFERVVYDLKTILGWKMDYALVWWPSSPYMPVKGWSRFHQWVVDIWDTLTCNLSWNSGLTSSYPNCFRAVMDNIHRFICWWVLPWRRWRWRFMNFFVNHNGSKLLDDAASWVYIRNREADCRYYEMRFTGLHYKLIRTRWLSDDKEGGCNTFIHFVTGFLAAATGDDKKVEEAEEEAKKIRKEEKVICSGWVFGVKSFVREMDKVVEATPDLGWIKSY